MVNVTKEHLEFLEKQQERLFKIEGKILDLQMNANDRPEEARLNHEDLKMEVFKLWYFATFNKEYGEDE